MKKELITFTCIIFLLMSCSGCLFYGETGGYEVKEFFEDIYDVKERLDLVVCTVNVDISIDAL